MCVCKCVWSVILWAGAPYAAAKDSHISEYVCECVHACVCKAS